MNLIFVTIKGRIPIVPFDMTGYIERVSTDQSLVVSAYCKSLFSASIFRLRLHFYSHVIFRLLSIGDF